MRYYDILLYNNGAYQDTLNDNERGVIYIVDGIAHMGDTSLAAGQAIFLEAGEMLAITSRDGCRLMACYGQPHNEPIIQTGPFVD